MCGTSCVFVHVQQELGTWEKFLDWLSESGLLTSKVQSRGSPDVACTSLDGLRQGDVGAAVARGSVNAALMFTNDLLP